MVWLLILVFIGVIGFLVYKHNQEENEDVSTTYSTPPAPVPPSKPIINDSPVKAPEAAEYIGIYEYTACRDIKRCSCCDAENDRSAHICCICGNSMEQ